MKWLYSYLLILVLLGSAPELWAQNSNRSMQRMRVGENWARARGEDSEDRLEAKTSIMAEKDELFEWPPQIPGLEYHAEASVSSSAPDGYQHYGGVYHVNADANSRDGGRDLPHLIKWQGSITHNESRSKAKNKNRSVNLDNANYFDHLSQCEANAEITGDYPALSLQHNADSGASAEAFAEQFAHNSTPDWDCYNCEVPQCVKCGGNNEDDGDGTDTDESTSEVIAPSPSSINGAQTMTTPCSGCGESYTSSESSDHASTTGLCGHTYYACRSDDHEWVYELCAAQHAHYECDGSDHASTTGDCGHTYYACQRGLHDSLQSCPTDANGQACLYGSFYECLPEHTHAYPPPPAVGCGARSWTGCTVSVSSPTEHQVASCGSGCGNDYWTCNSSAVAWHTAALTCRRSGCGASYTMCTKGNGTCSGGRYIWHN